MTKGYAVRHLLAAGDAERWPLRDPAAPTCGCSPSSRYEAGRRVRLQAELSADDDSMGVQIRSHVVLPDGRRLSLDFTPEVSAKGGYRAEFDATLPGEYRVSASATTEGKTLADASTVLSVRPARGEECNPAGRSGQPGADHFRHRRAFDRSGRSGDLAVGRIVSDAQRTTNAHA